MSVFKALQEFAEMVSGKLSQVTPGEPEDQLRAPFEILIANIGNAIGTRVVCTGETRLPGRLGKPDYAIHLNRLLTGYAELKAPGTGVNVKRFSGHNREQWKRFQTIPNLLYTDGNEWALYRNGTRVGKVICLTGELVSEGKKAVEEKDAIALENLLRDFLAWRPVIPTDRHNKIDLRAFADLLAPLCRMLRDDVTEAIKDPQSPLVGIAKDWRQLLFPDASDEQFADAYAQTVAFALLLGRSEGADPLTLSNAEQALAAQHTLLSRALLVLTEPEAREEISASLNLLLRVIAEVPVATLTGPEDPWLYFYEDFLAAYDPGLRKDAGAYYTPVEVVRAQVRLIDKILSDRLNKPLGFADPNVVTLDPAVGTGTYLLGVIEHSLNKIRANQGEGAVPGQATALARNLHGFEIMVGPFAVSELRISRALIGNGATLPEGGSHVYLTDTLESPFAQPPQLPVILRPIAEQHSKALKVKSKVPVIVCLGNPPYDRHKAVDVDAREHLSRWGGWVRFADEDDIAEDRLNISKRSDRLLTRQQSLALRESKSILYKSFIKPAMDAGHGGDVKNLYNLYIYFWRWALWKVFEHDTSPGTGVVSFISGSSYLDGDAFCGMRKHMRELCDEIWILDLGGEGRGTRKSENVFAIQTPVAIAVAVRNSKPRKGMNAKVHYVNIEGSREDKLKVLDSIQDFGSLQWEDCPEDLFAPFRPAGKGKYFNWPLLTDLMPWQHSGCEVKRTWPICHDKETLVQRWRALLASSNKANAFRETRDRKVSIGCSGLLNEEKLPPIDKLKRDAPVQPIERYAYRSFDRQWLIADPRLGDYLRPDLWRIYGKSQVFFTSLFNHPLGNGPAITVCGNVPDRHLFRGSFGGKDIIPLYRDRKATKANFPPILLTLLNKYYKRAVAPEDLAAYIYCLLSQPEFTLRFSKELRTRELRVPLTRDPILFAKARAFGARLLWLHTYGERFVPEGKHSGHVPRGATRCIKAIPEAEDGYPDSFAYNESMQTLHVGPGEFRPVLKEVFEFEVSGLKVVQSWLRYRMREGAGKKSSPLDDIRPVHWTSQLTTDLLELLWVLDVTVSGYPEQAEILEQVVSGPCIDVSELPEVPDFLRKPPSAKIHKEGVFKSITQLTMW